MGADHHDKQRLRDAHTKPERDNDTLPHDLAAADDPAVADPNSNTDDANPNSSINAASNPNTKSDTNPNSSGTAQQPLDSDASPDW